MIRLLITGMFLLFSASFSLAAPLYFFPVELTQPDGKVIKVFLTGDEYYNWVHDVNNYTIIQNQLTGYYVYATLSNDELVPTEYIAGQVNPALTTLVPAINISRAAMLEKRKAFLDICPPDMGDAPTTGTINNLVIYIRFNGEPEFTDNKVKYDTMFNNTVAGANSMVNYFKEVSYNALTISSTFYPTTGGTTVISYQDANPRGYYQPYSTSNTIGYTGGNNGSQRTTREHTLLVNAVNYVSSQVPAALNLDGDNDGKVDNVCFVVYGSPGAWADLLWPHRWALYSYTVNINGKRVYDYNFQLQTSLFSSGVGVLCHEMFHSLGSPDLYHYSYDGLSPTGAWDVMESNRNPPQHMGAYMKYRYGHWISSIPVISNGSYSLNPLTSSSGNCYRINSPNSSTEYYVVEYRRKTGTFEGSLPGTGLLIYRINTAVDGEGNADGPPDEVYIYRPNGTPTVNGTVSSANYSSNVGRTAINDATNPSPFLSTGSAGGLNISSIGASGETISFVVGSTAAPNAISNLTAGSPSSNSLTLQWTVPSAGITDYDIRYAAAAITTITSFNNAIQVPYSGTPGGAGTLESFVVQGLNPGTTYYFCIRSRNIPDNWSGLSNSPAGITWTSPQIQVNPLSIINSFTPGTTHIDTIRISNIRTAPSTLNFNLSLENNTFPSGVIEKAVLSGSETNVENLSFAKNNQQEGNGSAVDGSGGPDTYGYEWIDSNEPGGPVYVWQDISTTGTLATNWTSTGTYDPKDEGYTGPIALGFDFNFYGNQKSQVYISSNGLLSFNIITTDIYTNNPIPNTGVPNEFIAPFWDDLDGSSQGTVHYKQDGERFIVQFSNWPRYSQAGSLLTFQTVINSNGTIEFYYNSMSGTLNSATTGIEDSAGTTGLQVAYNTAFISNGLAVKISSAPDWLSSNITYGTVYSGNFIDIILTFTSAGLPYGSYSMDVKINSNDPANPIIIVPVIMNLKDVVTLSSFKALVEGLYNGDKMIPDTVVVELHNSTSPYAKIDSIKILLDSLGMGTGTFSEAVSGNSYFIAVKHRNGIETWSSSGQTVVSSTLSYDFTTLSSQAYGNNLVEKGSKWCIYSGDINRDGSINSNDLTAAAAAAVNYQAGYTPADVNGDRIVDLQDLSIIENNKNKVIGVITP